ncbi:hypothetical protein GCM10027275_39310 [Rhabdobacter roseus]|uniref:Uncharacterized protein n=1 Tax=Rhabdobacter roseus TaxID=1655419 RepID=A0A840TMY9_9BACT|nr:hypothetical protein [Rhabdobacter roseus]MBB5285636.1 hypothetical protein [Rhabdobacter roseus]
MRSTFFLLSLVLGYIGCQDEPSTKLEQTVIEADAQVVNTLAADGCSWHFELKQADSTLFYAATASSAAKIKAAVPAYGTDDAYSFTPVRLKYRTTANKQQVVCGWGNKAEFTEIEILEIQRK